MALAAVKGDYTIAELSQKFDVHPNQIAQWKNQLLEQASEVFEPGGSKEPSVDIKTLHAKIGELTLENDLLEKALTKAGLKRYFHFYNNRRPHSSLAGHTPDQVYFSMLSQTQAA